MYSASSSRRSRRQHGAGESPTRFASSWRSEEHTSELQSQSNLVCRLLLEKKKTNTVLRLVLFQVLRVRRGTLLHPRRIALVLLVIQMPLKHMIRDSTAERFCRHAQSILVR